MNSLRQKEKKNTTELQIPWINIRHLISHVVKKTDILYKLPDDNLLREIKQSLIKIKKLLIVKLISLTKKEFEPIFEEFNKLYEFASNVSENNIDSEFIRLYEWYYILKEIEYIFLIWNIDLKKFSVLYRESIRNERNRNNTLWNLLTCIKKSLI